MASTNTKTRKAQVTIDTPESTDTYPDPPVTTGPVGVYQDIVSGIRTDTDDESYTAAIGTYVAASSGNKARMRTWLARSAQEHMLTLDVSDPSAVSRTKALVNLQTAQAEALKSRETAPTDPRLDCALVVAALIAAAYEHMGTGSPGDWNYVNDLVVLATGVNLSATHEGIPEDVRTLATRIKIPTSRRGTSQPGGDIATHILQALQSVPVGTALTVAEIKSACTDIYPTGAPSGGAISARLFPTKGECTVGNGVKPTYKDGKKAATLVAARS